MKNIMKHNLSFMPLNMNNQNNRINNSNIIKYNTVQLILMFIFQYKMKL